MTPQELIDYKKQQIAKKQEEIIPKENIDRHLTKIFTGIKKKIDGLCNNFNDDVNYTYHCGEKYILCCRLVSELEKLGYVATTCRFEYEICSISKAKWMYNYVSVDLTPIKEAIYGTNK